MKMGIEKRLKERIPEITSVIQAESAAAGTASSGPEVTKEEVEKVLDTLRQFVSFLGGGIQLVSIEKSSIDDSSVIRLKLEGGLIEFQSIKAEINERLMKHFKRKSSTIFDN
jgi:Fe-S cluster biogenesis protein NfuA